MFNINFSNDYKVVHINNELGNCVVGGAGTYMNEMYRYRRQDTGFIYMSLGLPTDDYSLSDFMEQKDILIMNREEAGKLRNINCDIFAIQFYEFADYLDEDIISGKKLVYVIHSVPTPEPPPSWDPFGGNDDIRMKFEKLCNLAEVLVCVSEAEKQKLIRIYPQYEEKISYGLGNAYGAEIGLYSNTDGDTWYAAVEGEQEIRTEQRVIDKKTGKELIHNDVASYTDDGQHFWNLAIRTSDGYTKNNLTQESTLYIEDEGLREATYQALSDLKLQLKWGDNNEILVYCIIDI